MPFTSTIAARCLLLVLAFAAPAMGQDLREAYQRAERFLPSNLLKLIAKASVTPHWLGKSDRFWYRNEVQGSSEFLVVDPERGTRERAFDHDRLASALAKATGDPQQADHLPF